MLSNFNTLKIISVLGVVVVLFFLYFLYNKNNTSLVKVGKDYIFYNGEITLKGANELINTLKNNKNKHFYINSFGGSSEAGLKIGEFISKNDVAVSVIGNCHSSCANYIFLPSKTRSATADAQIGLHGGYQSYYQQRLILLSKIPVEYQNLYLKTFDNEFLNINNEIDLLVKAKINPEIINQSAKMTLYGEASYHLTVKDSKLIYKAPKITNSPFELWFPAVEEYIKWGITINTIETPKFIKKNCIKKSKFYISRLPS
jgi:hypothetical protein